MQLLEVIGINGLPGRQSLEVVFENGRLFFWPILRFKRQKEALCVFILSFFVILNALEVY